MPELPEVETTVRGLRPLLVGARLDKVTVRAKQLRFPFPPGFAKKLTGATVLSVERRAKYILVNLSGGAVLLIHLGMSGRLVTASRGTAPATHDHVIFLTDKGAELRFHDPRRFGIMDLIKPGGTADHKLLAPIGPEPLGDGLTPAYLKNALHGKTAAIKTLLLDQRLIAGLGNIYVSEALFGAGIRPTRRGGTLTGKETERLVTAIRNVLNDAIGAGGTSMRDYVQANGELGHFQDRFAVYGRDGAGCLACKAAIRRLVQGGRASFYCPSCQS